MMARMVFIVALFWAGFAHALAPGEALDDPALEARARVISSQLRCLTCQNQNIDESPSEIAKDLRLMVRERLLMGESNGQIIDFAVARYGEFVLLKPRLALHTFLLWLSPLGFVLLGGLFIWRLRLGQAAAGAANATTLNDDEQEALKKIRQKV